MREIAGNLPLRFFIFCHLGFETSAHKLPEERESENPRNVAGMEQANTVEIGETSTSPPKGSSSLEEAPVRALCIGA